MNELAAFTASESGLVSLAQTHALIIASDDRAEQRFWEFFTDTIHAQTRPRPMFGRRGSPVRSWRRRALENKSAVRCFDR